MQARPVDSRPGWVEIILDADAADRLAELAWDADELRLAAKAARIAAAYHQHTGRYLHSTDALEQAREERTQPCKNCSEQYDPDDKSDPTWGAFVGPRYCGQCGAQEARIIAAELGVLD